MEPFDVLVYDETTIHYKETVLAKSEAAARDKAIKALDNGVDLDSIQVRVRPF